jgi:hypothetical protein
LLDPKLSATEVTPLWRPELVPTAVMLTKSPKGFPQAMSLDKAILAAALAQSDGTDGLHIRLPDDHQLWLLDKHPDRPLAVVIPLDDDLPLRAASAVRLHRLITDKKVGPPPRPHVLTAQQRRRLILMLRSLEGHLSKASYREIASAIFDSGVAREKAWKTRPIRAQTIRLVNDAMKMVNRGYLKLLRGR